MKRKMKYWDILCEKHLETLFRFKINTKHISEKNLNKLIRTLLSKYALSNEEILEQHLKIPFKNKIDLIKIERYSNRLGEPLSISYLAQIADISITIELTD